MTQEIQEEKEIISGAHIPEGRYVEAIGRRKTASARVRVREEKGVKKSFIVNKKELHEYFPAESMREAAKSALGTVKAASTFSVEARVKGSGPRAQADAVRQGLARVLSTLDVEWKKKLKKAGLLKPDTRIVERKKFGLKKARKAPQWSKR